MGWLSRLFGATPKEELDGIRLNTREPYWELEGKTDFPLLLRALLVLVPDDSILYLEGGSPEGELLDFFNAKAVPEQTHVAIGTIWPRPRCYHVPATAQNLTDLADIAESCAWPELAIHFHVYRDGRLLLEWHDAFSQPMLLSGSIPDDKVRGFSVALGMTYALNKGEVEQVDARDEGPSGLHR
ncbi:MAG TPA: hypothetical protein VMZ31_16780 [Phycisphaerae bacterium]|nr:hypothetical protein [Phycisphaerae bacterium]